MDKKHVYTTVNGREVEYQAISLDALQMTRRGLQRAYRERGEPIEPPTYEIVTASGAKITETHDDTTSKSDTEQVAWDEHVLAKSKLDYEYSAILMRYVFDDGLAGIVVPEDTAWQEKYRARYIDIPTDPQELRDFYITAEILPTKVDRRGLTTAVLTLSEIGKVDPDALEVRLDMFRGDLEREAAQRIKRTQRKVEAQSKID